MKTLTIVLTLPDGLTEALARARDSYAEVTDRPEQIGGPVTDDDVTQFFVGVLCGQLTYLDPIVARDFLRLNVARRPS